MPELPDSIKRKPIQEFVISGVPQVNLGDPAANAIKQYKESSYHLVLVVQDSDGSLAGILTDNELVGITGEGTVQGILPDNRVIAVRSDATLADLLDVLNGGNSEKRVLERVPVVDVNNRPVGIVDRDKLTIRIGEIFADQPA